MSLLIAAAMILGDLVMVRFAARDLIRAKVEAGRLLVRSLESIIAGAPGLGGRAPALTAGPYGLEVLLEASGYEGCVMVDTDGREVFTAGGTGKKEEAALRGALGALQAGGESVDFAGRTWAVVWTGPEYVRVCSPVRAGGRVIGGVCTYSSLDPVYARLRGSQKIMAVYILLDTLVLALAGLYLLSRSVVGPIRRLVEKTEEYRGGEFSVSLEAASGSEIGLLSRSIGNMLRRLEQNEKALKENIASLEQANEELRQAREETIRSEKLASVGRLAAGIAHEIGNPLGIILGYLELIRSHELGEEEKADFLQRVEAEITRINTTIRNLLDFSRASDAPEQRLALHGVIMETAGMLSPQPGFRDKPVDLSLDAESDQVWGDRSRLKQVFLNLLMNAADALSERSPETGEGPRISISTRVKGERIEAAVTDNGPGIPCEDMDKVFDPFYTTKEPGKGTGLGLSVSHRIVEDLGGEMRVESALGRGTTVVVLLPLDREASTGGTGSL